MITIKELRKLICLSQDRFAEAYGIPAPTIRNWEQGKSEPPAYVAKMLNKMVRQSQVATMTWIFEEYRDRAGTGSTAMFSTKEEAVEAGKAYWQGLSEGDKNTYRNDEAPTFNVALYSVEWDDEEEAYVPQGDPLMVAWDALGDPLMLARAVFEK